MKIHPRCALWLLHQSGAADQNDPIAGDLLEEYASGRPASWLWRQTLMAVLAAALAELWRHKLLAFRAVGIGLAVVLTAGSLKQKLTLHHAWADGLFVFWLLTLLTFLLTGLCIGLFHRRQRMGMALAFVIYAGIAKAWVYTSHFQHYWKPDHLDRFLVDLGLTGLGFVLVFTGSLLTAPSKDSRTQHGA